MAAECKHGQLARSCEICDRDAEINRLTARIAELGGLFDGTFGQCVYCGKRDIPIVSRDHWLECPSHPANARIEELLKDNHELNVDLVRARMALGMIHTYLRCKPRQVGCALDVIRALERSLTSEHAKSKNQQLTEPG
jgi:hypothetical protein